MFVQGTAPRTMEETLQRARGELQLPIRPQPITTVSVLPTGTHRVWVHGFWLDAAGGGLSGRSAAEVAFTDRAGRHWIRRANGQLEELPVDPIDYFADLGLSGPFDLQTPERMP